MQTLGERDRAAAGRGDSIRAGVDKAMAAGGPRKGLRRRPRVASVSRRAMVHRKTLVTNGDKQARVTILQRNNH
ncbi:MAG: hypothetical protein ACTHNM_07775 [Dyella sp.]|uniref:hypothetical protein n=1 Tax=Dyella sp. TaxID=1869338 RepID=UPI003F7EA70D